MASVPRVNSVIGPLTRLQSDRAHPSPASLTIRLITRQVSGAFMRAGHFVLCRADTSTSITWDLITRRLRTTKELVVSSARLQEHGCGAALNIGTITRSIRFSGVALDLITFGHGLSRQKQATDLIRHSSNRGLHSRATLTVVIAITQIELSTHLMLYTNVVLTSAMRNSSASETSWRCSLLSN